MLSAVPLSAVFSLAAALTLGGCATERADQALQAQQALVGLSRSALVQCAGDPQRQTRQGGIDYLTYSNEPVASGGAYGPNVGVGVDSSVSDRGIDGTRSTQLVEEIRSDYCEVTFSLVGNRVERVTYRTPAGFGQRRYGRCLDVVATCLRSVNRAVPQALPDSPE